MILRIERPFEMQLSIAGSRLKCACLAVFLLLLSFAARAERAAFVYCDWHANRCRGEFDAHFKKLGWSFDAYENVRVHELTANLTNYDVVVLGTVANFTHTVNLKDYAESWLRWLNAGGALIVTDANYPSVLESWVGSSGLGFGCGSATCSAHKHPTVESCAVTLADDPILTCPRPLGSLIRDHYVQWSHLTGLGPDWRKSIVCSDDQATFACRPTGNGIVVLTSASMMHGNREIPLALLENVALWRRLKAAGIEVVGFSAEDVELDVSRRYAVRLQVDASRIRKVSAELTACRGDGKARGDSARAEVFADVPTDGHVTLVPQLTLRRKGATSLAFVLRADGRELFRRVWTETESPALGVKLVRKHLFVDDVLRPVLALRPPKAGAKKLIGVEWKLDDSEWALRSDSFADWKIPVRNLTEGRHEIHFRLCYAKGFLDSLDTTQREFLDWNDEQVLEFFWHRQARYRVRPDGTVLEDGRPFFPFGFYLVAWSQTDALRLKAAKDMADWGYNTLHTGIRLRELKNDGYGAFLDECERLGVRIVTEFENSTMSAEAIRRYRGKAAVLGWNPGDEPGANGLGADAMFSRYDRFKQLDPDHLVYTAVCESGRGMKYATGTDVLVPDPYPVPEKSLGMVHSFLEALRRAAKAAGSGVWCAPQAFGGQGYAKNTGWTRPPTGAEFRAMSYLALTAGAKGLVYYVYRDDSFDILKEPELLSVVKDFPAELKDVIPFVLNGRFRPLEQGEKGRYSAVWELGRRRLSVAVDITGNVPETSVDFTAKQ